ncbi:MAG: alpha,alpha-phosphotrehalase [Acidobacteriota bacterium]|nr:alpha,alpha-phosphotrehalase [Acidobacteriota bacterium]
MAIGNNSRARELGSKVAYEIYVRSFSDSTGNGVGDLRGITQRLDYLADLGVDYLWITPFFVSPLKDGGYDVADYRNIDPVFGTMDDFDELVREADARGIGLMLDMVFNHTSDQHEWFQRARAGDPRYQAYYLLQDPEPGATADDPGKPPTNWESKFGGNAWTYSPEMGKWYLHLYDASQPDLNWRNPEVRSELASVLRFWKDRGVKGFRFDVVNNISKPVTFEDDLEGDGRRFYTDGEHVDEYLRLLVREGGIDGMMTVGEMSSTTIERCISYSNPDNHELAMTFSFHHFRVDNVGGNRWSKTRPDIPMLREAFRSWQEEMTAAGGWNALFWTCHDQPRPTTRFGDDTTPESWRRSAKLLPLCTFLLRGTPYIYQGEELGMTNPGFTSIDQYRDVESINYHRIMQEEGGKSEREAFEIIAYKSRDNGRTPVQWDDTPNAGFTTGELWIGVSENYTWLNAQAEIDDPDSVLAFYKRLIALRKAEEIIQAGDVRFLDSPSDKVIAYERTLGDERVVVQCNFSGEPQPRIALEGGELLVSNYDNAAEGDMLRPWEGTAQVWRG